MPTATIDNKQITVEKGTTILQAALQNGIHIPHYCYHPALKIDGNCRMCLVEVEKMPKLTISCNTVLTDGMVVKTDTHRVLKARKGVLEFFLINHPLDCPVCDKSGECILQDYSYTYGSGTSRFVENKVVTPKKDIGEHILIYSNRCILCSRCVRFCKDVSGTNELGIINRGGVCEIDIFPLKRLDNKLSGNVVDICPVGALTSKDFLFQCRVWHLKKYESICTRCSAGCNIIVEVKDDTVNRVKVDRVYRVTPRHNPYVNGYWICNIGRYNHNGIISEKRLDSPLNKDGVRQAASDWDTCILVIKEKFSALMNSSSDSTAALLSAGATNEENFLLVKLMNTVFKTKNIALHNKYTEGSDERFPLGFAIEADKNPNHHGALHMLNESGTVYTELTDKIRAGTIKGLYILGDRSNHGFSKEEIELFKGLEFLVVQDTYQSDLTAIAHIVLPSTIYLEKEGTFTNSRGIVQRIRRAIFPQHTIRDGWQIIQMISDSFDSGFGYNSSKEVFADIAKTVSTYSGLSYEKVGRQGAKV